MTMKIGHRGAGGTHPENTMASFARAVELGVGGVEFDVHRCQDGQLVVIHDPSVERTTSGRGLVKDLTLAQLKELDAGAWKHARFAGERIPTLRELIESLPASCRLFIELKAGSIHYPGIEAQLVTELKDTAAAERSQISSFDHHALLRIHTLEPDLELGMLFADNPVDPVAMARACGASALHPYFQWVTPGMVEMARSAGLKINVWTVNSPQQIALLKQLGVDGIISDYPDRL